MAVRAFQDPLLRSSRRLGGSPRDRVRLRIARAGDEARFAALLARLGLQASELELSRLVRFDPRRRAVICAGALVGGAEAVVGFGAIWLDGSEPDLLVVDPEHAGDLAPWLDDALRARAHRPDTAAAV